MTTNTPSIANANKKMTPGAKRAITAATFGTLIEWYDYALYGAAAGIVLGPLFFTGPYETLAALATFAVGFIVRPLGGLFFANLGDKIGRKPVLIATIVVMGVATMAIGLIPSAASIGLFAPILLLIFRALQGFGAGAELAGALTLVSEYAPQRRRGFATGLISGMGGGGTLLATLAFTFVSLLPDEEFMSWGWRLPFLASFVLFVLAIYIRNRLEETPEYIEAMAKKKSDEKEAAPLREVIKQYPRSIIAGFMVWVGHNFNYYLIATFSLAFMTGEFVGMARSDALIAVLLGSVVHVIAAPTFGALADRVGFRKVFGGTMISAIILIIPIMFLLGSGDLLFASIGMVLGFGGIAAGTNGSSGGFVSNLFPTRYRYSGLALTREINSAIVGGFAPVTAAALISLLNGEIWLVAIVSVIASMTTLIGIKIAGKNAGNYQVEDSLAEQETITP